MTRDDEQCTMEAFPDAYLEVVGAYEEERDQLQEQIEDQANDLKLKQTQHLQQTLHDELNPNEHVVEQIRIDVTDVKLPSTKDHFALTLNVGGKDTTVPLTNNRNTSVDMQISKENESISFQIDKLGKKNKPQQYSQQIARLFSLLKIPSKSKENLTFNEVKPDPKKEPNPASLTINVEFLQGLQQITPEQLETLQDEIKVYKENVDHAEQCLQDLSELYDQAEQANVAAIPEKDS